MLCKVCNTRLGANDRHCPNCGQDAPAEAAFSRTSPPMPLPKAELSTARDETDNGVVELDEVSGERKPLAKKTKAPAKKPAPKKAEKPAVRSAPKKPAAPPNAPPPPTPSGGSPLFAPDPASLRALLAESPDTLEAGLEVYRDDSGEPVGASYTSGVGEIDLLARDNSGELVVVMISEKGQGEELIGEVLQRVGWVRKHIGGGKAQVRGIVLCEEAPEGLSYAASAVAGTVSFKTYRVALTFEDLEV
jgi:hypothetical protein